MFLIQHFQETDILSSESARFVISFFNFFTFDLISFLDIEPIPPEGTEVEGGGVELGLDLLFDREEDRLLFKELNTSLAEDYY